MVPWPFMNTIRKLKTPFKGFVTAICLLFGQNCAIIIGPKSNFTRPKIIFFLFEYQEGNINLIFKQSTIHSQLLSIFISKTRGNNFPLKEIGFVAFLK